MVYLHKLLPALLLPVGVVLALLLIAGLSKTRKALFWGTFLLLVFSTPMTANLLFRAVEQFQTRPQVTDVEAGDAIVVLSGMLNAAPGTSGDSVVEWMDPDRFFAGVELYKAGKAPRLVFTGGTLPWLPASPPEGAVLKRYASQMGVPADHIHVTTDVQHTEDEAREVRKDLGQTNKIILVTSAFHMPRARQLFLAYGFEVVPFPVDFRVDPARTFTVLDVLPNAASLLKSEIAMRELFGRAFYTVKLAFRSSPE